MEKRKYHLKGAIERALSYLTEKYGAVEDDGTKFLRIDENDLFEGDGGVSFQTAVEWIEREIDRAEKYQRNY